MKKYLKTLLIILCFLFSLPIVFSILLKIPPEVFGCQGFGCIGIIFLIPPLTVALTIPIAILLYHLLTKNSDEIEGSFTAFKTFLVKPFPKKKIIIFLSLVPTLLLALIIVSSLMSDNDLMIKNTKPIQSSPTASKEKKFDQIAHVDSVDWKTFLGNEIQVSYPPSWILKSPSNSDHIVIFSFEPVPDTQKLLQDDGIRLEIYPKEYDQTHKNFEEVVNFYDNIYMAAPNITIAPDQKTTVGGVTAVKRKVTIPEKDRLFTNYYYFISGKNKTFIITYMLHDLNEKQESVINQILSTFKFFDTGNPTSDTPYTCPENGWVNCQPILSEKEQQDCTREAFDWYEINCPNYEGAAY